MFFADETTLDLYKTDLTIFHTKNPLFVSQMALNQGLLPHICHVCWQGIV